MGTPPWGEGFPGIVSGVSSIASFPLAVGEGLAKGAEGVAGALAGLSLGLGGVGEEGGGGGGFRVPPEAVEVREGGGVGEG